MPMMTPSCICDRLVKALAWCRRHQLALALASRHAESARYANRAHRLRAFARTIPDGSCPELEWLA